MLCSQHLCLLQAYQPPIALGGAGNRRASVASISPSQGSHPSGNHTAVEHSTESHASAQPPDAMHLAAGSTGSGAQVPAILAGRPHTMPAFASLLGQSNSQLMTPEEEAALDPAAATLLVALLRGGAKGVGAPPPTINSPAAAAVGAGGGIALGPHVSAADHHHGHRPGGVHGGRGAAGKPSRLSAMQYDMQVEASAVSDSAQVGWRADHQRASNSHSKKNPPGSAAEVGTAMATHRVGHGEGGVPEDGQQDEEEEEEARDARGGTHAERWVGGGMGHEHGVASLGVLG